MPSNVEIVSVNGKDKRVFVLGTRRFLAPAKIGAGYRELVERIQAEGAVSMERFAAKLRELKIGNQIQSEEALKEVMIEATAYSLHAETASRDSLRSSKKLATLRALLTPEDGDVLTVEDWLEVYTDEASEEQVQEVLDFFDGKSPTKTTGDSSTTSRGKSTARKSKASQ